MGLGASIFGTNCGVPAELFALPADERDGGMNSFTPKHFGLRRIGGVVRVRCDPDVHVGLTSARVAVMVNHGKVQGGRP